MLMFIVSISFAQYTPMTAAGYQFKRILCDSTLHIPSFCGIPTLRNSTAKNGAIAMDTCNYKFYMWTNIGGWSQIVGAGTDTTSLSNRIDQRVKYTDTAAMLTAYLRKQDTANKFVANVTRVNDTTIRVYKGNTITDLKILGKVIDTTSLSNRINLKVNISDTATMLSKYLRKTDTASLSNRINLKLNISDTTNKFVNAVTKVNDSTIRVWKGTTSTTIELPRGSGGGSGSVTNVVTGYGLSGGPITSTGTILVDSATLSTKYLRRADTSNLVATKSNVALKLNITDTTNKFVNNVTKINDTSIRVWKGTTSTVISLAKDVVYTQSPIMSKISNDSNIIYFNADTAAAWRGGGGSGGSQNLQQVTDLGASTTNPIYIDNSNYSHIVLNRPSATAFDYTDVLAYSSTLDSSTSLNGFLIRDSTPGFTSVPNVYAYGQVGAANSDYSFGIENNNTLGALPFLRFNAGGKMFSLNENSIYFKNGSGFSLKWNIPNATSSDSYMPVSVNGIFPDNTGNINITGGTGTVTNVATGYGLSGGPITNTGTLIVDTATLSGKYIKGSGTINYVPKFSATRDLAISQIFDNGTSVGINTASPTSTYKLDVNGIINTNNGVNITTNGSKTGFYGATNAIDIFAGNSKISTYGLPSIGGSIFDNNFPFNYGSSASGTVNNMRIASNVVPNGNNSVDINQLIINPTYQQITGSGTGTGTLRGIYYNPTLTSLGTSKNIAFHSTSGDIIFNNLKTSTSTTDSIAIFVNDTLKKAAYPSVASATRLITTVYNNSGATIAKGSVVYINGSHGSATPTIALSLANAEATSARTYGLVESDIANNASGTVVQMGSVTNLNLPTGTYTDGQTVYLSPTTPGGLTTTKPLAPNHLVVVGTVTRAHPTLGIIQVSVKNGFELYELADVQVPVVPADSTLLQFSRVDSLWKAVSVTNAIGAKYIRPSDTSVLQRKSISAYTMLANNTNAAANATAQTFRDTAGTYAGTITWTGTAPTTQTINYYQWQQTGKWVRLQIFGNYTNAGTACTAVQLTLPADCPAPDISMFATGALAILYQGLGGLGTSGTSVSLTANSYMRRNAANNGNELFVSAASNNYRRYQVDITYRAQ